MHHVLVTDCAWPVMDIEQKILGNAAPQGDVWPGHCSGFRQRQIALRWSADTLDHVDPGLDHRQQQVFQWAAHVHYQQLVRPVEHLRCLAIAVGQIIVKRGRRDKLAV